MPTIIDGLTGIDRIKAGSVEQGDLMTGVAGSGPAFSANDTSTSVPSATDTPLVLSTEAFDTANCFNLANGRFTPNVPGYYLLMGGINYGGATGISGKGVRLRKNGSIYIAEFFFSTGDTGPWQAPAISGMGYFNGTTDYAELVGYVAAGGPVTPVKANFSGFLARAA